MSMVSNFILASRNFSALALVAFVVGCSSATPPPGGNNPPGDDAPPTDGDGSNDAGVPPVDVNPPPPAIDPVEPVWRFNIVNARVKSPNQRMHFTAGLPFRILADANDPRAYQCPPGHYPYVCPDSSMAFFVDGALVGVLPPSPTNTNLWELRMPNGLPAGDHVITVRFTPHDAPAVDGLVPIYIRVDPVPSHSRTITLTSDLVLTGTTDLDWTDAVVRGHGHRVISAPGYAGKVTINNSFVTGLAAFDNQVGINITTSGGVDIASSVFEATAPLRLAVNGSAPIKLVGNEFRSTNYVTYKSSDPNASPILELAGNTSGAKLMQGNNIGAGIVRIEGMSGWQIGGLRDSQANIFVGPRCVLHLDGSPNATIQGNYFHHDYYGGFSQGFNLHLSGSGNALAEHNVIRDGSWPLQSFGGEFRYNLMINSGHTFIRSSQSGARYHHNIFAHAQAPNTQYDGVLFVYGNEQNLVFDSNTIDAGGGIGDYDAPALALGSSGVSFASVRNNVFAQFGHGNRPIVAGGGPGRIAKADYNAWHNPLANAGHYTPGLVAGAAGPHDIDGEPMFSGTSQIPYQVDEGQVWLRIYGVSQVLGVYRGVYAPQSGSPLVDAGDPTDGAGVDIGAIGSGATDPADKFGVVMQAN